MKNKYGTITIDGAKVELRWGEGVADGSLGKAIHTVPADRIAEVGPSDGHMFELEGKRYRLGSHDYSNDQPGCEDDEEVTCTAEIYLA